MSDEIHTKEDGKWYFWDETWSVEIGPFNTIEDACEGFKAYAKRL